MLFYGSNSPFGIFVLQLMLEMAAIEYRVLMMWIAYVCIIITFIAVFVTKHNK